MSRWLGMSAAALLISFVLHPLITGSTSTGGCSADPEPGQSISQSRDNAIVRAAREVGGAVVSISVIQTRVMRTSPLGPGFRDEFFEYF